VAYGLGDPGEGASNPCGSSPWHATGDHNRDRRVEFTPAREHQGDKIVKALLIGVAFVSLVTTAGFGGDACPDCPWKNCNECDGNGSDFYRYDVCFGPIGPIKCGRDALAEDAEQKVKSGLRSRDALRLRDAPRCPAGRLCSHRN
jgi:hypothetical protein